ncbi:MAG: hypothetical protein DDG59_11480 [Anaerolineae bacterium]|nr:MAG: hypothetical protein DDG59_11480 [Anaerolineae bacterium]
MRATPQIKLYPKWIVTNLLVQTKSYFDWLENQAQSVQDIEIKQKILDNYRNNGYTKHTEKA